jgi:acyl-CoA thioesterase-1
VQRLAQVHFAAAAIIQPGKNRQQRRLTRARLANQGDGLRPFDNSSTPVRMESSCSLTDGLLKMMNFNNVFRWHLAFLFLLLFSLRRRCGHVTGSGRQPERGLSHGGQYRLACAAQREVATKRPVNASISGDTSQQGLARLPALLKEHQPRWVLVELGGNDGLRGFAPQQTEQTLRTILQDIKAANAEPLLMQIRCPPTMAAVIMSL